MEIKMFNGWYFLWLAISIGSFLGLYFFLKNKTDKTKHIVLFSLLVFALVLHFLKGLFPPYSVDLARNYRDAWFVNICGANIALFPFLYFVKNKHIKDYMFYLGLFGGLIAVLYPMEPMDKSNQIGEWIDIIRFYVHHNILWQVPLLMVLLKLHKLSYKRVISLPFTFSFVLGFIMLNQLLQSELGYIPLRSDNFFDINYKNSSLIWGPSGGIGDFLAIFCPKVFKTVPVGEFAGQEKFWPLIWMVVPMFVLLVPACFLISLIFDHKNFVTDVKTTINFLKEKLNNKQQTTVNENNSENNK